MSVDYETVDYQARSAVAHRLCRARPCDEEYPALPSRWCDRCLMRALLQRLESPESDPAVVTGSRG